MTDYCIVTYISRLLVEQPALELVPCADCDQYPGLPRSVSSPEPRRPAAVRRGRQRRSRSRRRICVADQVCVRTDRRCTRTPLRRGIGPRPEDRPARRPRCPRRRKRAGRCRLCTGNMSQTPARTRQLLLQPIIHPTLLRCERRRRPPLLLSQPERPRRQSLAAAQSRIRARAQPLPTAAQR